MRLDIYRTTGWQRELGSAAIVACVVFVACLLGILTRPIGMLAALWPANAILLAMMVRNRELATVWGWLAAFTAYMAADLLTGGALLVTFALTAANMAGVLTGFFGFSLLAEDDRRLLRPQSVLYLFAICAGAGMAAALAGVWISALLFGTDFFSGLEFWFTTELVNSLVVMAPILTFPDWSTVKARLSRLPARPSLRTMAPAVALLVSAGFSTVSGGPGALAFPMPALLWCALSYSLFTTALLTAVLSCWLLIVVAAGLIVVADPSQTITSTTSIRLGIALMVLGPLTVAGVNSARNQALSTLSRAVNLDVLTGALSRRAFMERSLLCIAKAMQSAQTVTVLMFDIDHFKHINDRFGHQVGDRVLVDFVRVIEGALRDGDKLARLGGEEFALLLLGVTPANADMMAERLRLAIDQASFSCATGEPTQVSTSIGIATVDTMADQDPETCLNTLLGRADEALYAAKRAGRNRVSVSAAA